MASLRQHVLILFKRSINYNSPTVLLKNHSAVNTVLSRKFNNAPIEYTNNRDPAPLFFNEDIQNLLKKLTRINMSKVFRHRRLENKKIDTPVYKFMSDDELKKELSEAAERAKDLLQMPPVIKIREPINEIFSKDPALQGYETAKIVFTDITYGISNRDRLIVVRDTDGTLSKADWDVRERMNQIYFPQLGRELKKPLMFEDEHLKKLLERKEYQFILDLACAQFEPDDSEYQKITSLTYQHLNENNDFEILRSTRHFGPLIFFLTWFKSIDNLLLELIETSHIADTNSLIQLFNQLHENEAIGKDIKLQSEDDTTILEKYIKEKSSKKGQLELAMQSYKELLKQRLELEQGIKKAHGVA